MFELFDVTCRKAMGHSIAEAKRLGHEFIDTEHILLGLLKAGGFVVDVLWLHKADPESVRAKIEERHPPSPGKSLESGQLPFSPWAKDALLLAAREGESAEWINSGHLLLGLLLERRGIAGEVLRELNVDPVELRKRL